MNDEIGKVDLLYAEQLKHSLMHVLIHRVQAKTGSNHFYVMIGTGFVVFNGI